MKDCLRHIECADTDRAARATEVPGAISTRGFELPSEYGACQHFLCCLVTAGPYSKLIIHPERYIKVHGLGLFPDLNRQRF